MSPTFNKTVPGHSIYCQKWESQISESVPCTAHAAAISAASGRTQRLSHNSSQWI